MISMPKQLIHFEKVLSSLLRTVWSVLDRTPRELLHEVSDQKYFVDLQKASPHNEKMIHFGHCPKYSLLPASNLMLSLFYGEVDYNF